MKKYLIFSLLSLIVSVAHAERVYDIHPIKKIEANPINIAVMLMQENDTAGISSTLKYYGYERQTPPSGGWGAFTHPNGSTIKYYGYESTPPSGGWGADFTVEVTSKVSTKERDKILENLNFKKTGAVLEQKSVGFITRCTVAPHGTLLLQRITKSKE